MERYPLDAQVKVYPFSRQRDGDDVIIGRHDLASYLVLPADAVEVLDDLAAGKTVGEAQALHRDRYGEVPEMEEFLGTLEEGGLIQPCGTPLAPAAGQPSLPPTVNYHFTKLPQRFAQRLVSRPVLWACAALIALAVVALVISPAVLAGRRALMFSGPHAALLLLLLPAGWLGLFLHELGHLIAARAEGIPSRLGIGNRLWDLVAETDMTGIWMLPRRRRYLPLLAGPLVDAVSASALILTLFAHTRHWLSLPPLAFQLGQAVLLMCLLRIAWQGFFYLRTDFYYVIASLFGCRNLLGDTEVYLKNQVARFTRRVRVTDQSGVPAAEMKVVRWYALVWLLGRCAALSMLALIQIPVLVRYTLTVVDALASGSAASFQGLVGTLLPLIVALATLAIGGWLWIRGLLKPRS